MKKYKVIVVFDKDFSKTKLILGDINQFIFKKNLHHGIKRIFRRFLLYQLKL